MKSYIWCLYHHNAQPFIVVYYLVFYLIKQSGGAGSVIVSPIQGFYFDPEHSLLSMKSICVLFTSFLPHPKTYQQVDYLH